MNIRFYISLQLFVSNSDCDQTVSVNNTGLQKKKSTDGHEGWSLLQHAMYCVVEAAT